jgi:glutathione peroxidase
LGVVTILASSALSQGPQADDKGKAKKAPALQFKVADIDGKEVDLKGYLGKVLLIVNVASECGLTQRQYAALEPLYQKYKDRGFEILAFPANNFGGQEPGTNAQIKAFCKSKGVTFKVFAKISVKGEGIHPLYKFLTSEKTAGKFAGNVKWNFQKYLVDAHGELVGRFDPGVDPMSKEVTSAIEKALEQIPRKTAGAKD